MIAAVQLYKASDYLLLACIRMCHVSEGVIAALSSALADRDWEGLSVKPLLRRKLSAAQVALAQVFHCVVFQTTLQPLLDKPK